MSTTLANIQNSYMYNFPREVPAKIAQGFLITVAANLLGGCTSSVAILGGAIAATATIIEAVTRPIIRAIFPETPTIAKWIQIIAPRIMALSLAASIAPWIGLSYQVTSFVIPLIAWITLNDRFYEKNIGVVEVF